MTIGRVDFSRDALLDYTEAAKVLGPKVSTLRAWVRDGRCPCIRLGPRATRFTLPLLEEFCRSNLDPGRGE